ncbi:DUF2953 domain-containing protein [Acetivibrio ethanolgignens]|uniref:DUF2953 domain-containing protein n=1 Tax=Acetivibrio ethanolgignens TaxID=290052 RepID=UPI00071DE58B|nr:DUF2953 domain-containing protein [Acetivibrio ethanolgignens]
MRAILRILWILLSIIGIILAFILLLLLLVLFVPVRYRVYGRKKEDMYAKGQVSWLWHLIHASFLYENEKLKVVFRIFGIPITRFSLLEEDVKETVEESVEVVKQEAEKIASEVGVVPEEVKEEPPAEVITMEKRAEEPKPLKKQKIKTEKKKWNIVKAVEVVKQFWQENKAAIKVILQKAVAMLKALLPKKVEGTIWFGSGDPCTTGELTGALAVLYGFYGDKLQLYPDFTQAVFMGELFIVGRIRLFTFLRICITVVLDKDVRRLIKNIKNIKEDL